MASRLSRKLGEAVAVYRREPPELRAQFEHALVSTLEAFDVLGKGFSPDTGKILKEAIGQIFVDGYVGGAWAKVHAALAEEAPAIYVRIKDRLPSAGAGNNPLAL